MVKTIHRTVEDTLLTVIDHYLDEDDHNKVIYHNKFDVSHNGIRKAKNGKYITPDSLQNPSDSDTTFREKTGKRYKGYADHIVEGFDGEGNSVIYECSFIST